MDYLKAYHALVESRKYRGIKREAGYEVHHIVLKSHGGSDSVDNLVKLTYREHFIAHRLLCKIYPGDAKVHYAFLCMLRDPHGQRPMTSRMVETMKTNFSKFRKWHINQFNPGQTEASKKKARDRMNSDRNPMRGKPESNPTAAPHTVIFEDGTRQTFAYGKLGYESLGISRSSWIIAVRTGRPIPKFKVTKIVKG